MSIKNLITLALLPCDTKPQVKPGFAEFSTSILSNKMVSGNHFNVNIFKYNIKATFKILENKKKSFHKLTARYTVKSD